MRIVNDIQLDFDDVLIQPKRSTLNSRKEVEIYREFKWNDSEGTRFSFNAIPIISSNMGTCGTTRMASILAKQGYMCALEKHYSSSEINALFDELVEKAESENKKLTEYTQRIFITIGINDSLDVIREVKRKHAITGVVIDIANGYMLKLIDKVREVRREFPGFFIIVGNVVTPDVTTDLILAGANAVKCGIGSGAGCLSRMKTGVGRPQLSTIMDCADAAHQLHAYVVSDGGCVVPGDICKAFCAGADFVMLGGMLSGCDEAGGDLEVKNFSTNELDEMGHKVVEQRRFKQYYGMSSKYAQEKHFGQFNKYRASEGRTKLIPYTGSLIDTIEDINGSIRSCCTYIGSHNIKHMPKHATFYRVNHQLNTSFANCKDF